MLWNAGGCCGMLQGAEECCGVLWVRCDAVGYSAMLWNALECWGVLWDAVGCCRGAVKYCRVLQDASSASGLGGAALGAAWVVLTLRPDPWD